MQQVPQKSAQDFSTAVPYFTSDGLVLLGLEGVEKYIRRIRRALERRDFAAKQRAMEGSSRSYSICWSHWAIISHPPTCGASIVSIGTFC
jgi:hypothetical protein